MKKMSDRYFRVTIETTEEKSHNRLNIEQFTEYVTEKYILTTYRQLKMYYSELLDIFKKSIYKDKKVNFDIFIYNQNMTSLFRFSAIAQYGTIEGKKYIKNYDLYVRTYGSIDQKERKSSSSKIIEDIEYYVNLDSLFDAMQYELKP